MVTAAPRLLEITSASQHAHNGICETGALEAPRLINGHDRSFMITPVTHFGTMSRYKIIYSILITFIQIVSDGVVGPLQSKYIMRFPHSFCSVRRQRHREP